MKQTNIKERIKGYFFVNPSARLRVRQIERKLSASLPSVINYSRELEKEEILKKINIGEVTFYSADRASKKFLVEKKLFNIRSVYESSLIEHIIEKYSNPVIILFGSFSRGEDAEESDIDLYIETPKEQKFDLKEFEGILSRKIQVFNFKDIKQIKNLHLANNILNGIILNSFIEVFK